MEAKDQIKEDQAQNDTPAATLITASAATTAPFLGKKHKRLGQILKGRYRIESLVASGGMSDVYRAVDQHLEKAGVRDPMVAVKILRGELTQDANALSLLAREAAKSKRLSHPNIIRVHDLDHDGDTWFMVMELLDGEPLSRVIQRAKPNGLKWSGGRAVLEQMAAALVFSHKRGIVHADLKPSNIFCTREGEIKLLDFGVAQALKPQQHVDFLNPRNEDETTIYGYTPAYASPALVAGKDPSVRDDRYALACIAFELLSSRHPFERKKLSAEELGAFLLRKPRNMPTKPWRVIRGLLKSEGGSVALPEFQAALKPMPWSRYLYPTGLAAATGLAMVMGIQSHTRLEAAEIALNAHEIHAKRLDEIRARPPGELIAATASLSPLERAGLLKLEESRLLEYFTQNINEALQTPGRSDLPNVPAAMAALSEAQRLYPRDNELAQQSQQLSKRALSLGQAISEELQGRLEQGNYQGFAALDELVNLAADLKFLGAKSITPSAASIDSFSRQLATALADDDGAALARLVQVADLFFRTTAELAAPLAKAQQLKEAISALGAYHESRAAGEDPLYPRAAAKQFYASRLARWQQGIERAASSWELDAIYQDVLRQQNRIPADFAPLVKLKQRLADAYVNQADRLLANRRASQAQSLLEKAAALMRKASQNG